MLITRLITQTAAAKSLQSCLTLCDLIDGSPPGSPVPGILQARTLQWVAISLLHKLDIGNLIQMTIISIAVGKNPLEKMA